MAETNRRFEGTAFMPELSPHEAKVWGSRFPEKLFPRNENESPSLSDA